MLKKQGTSRTHKGQRMLGTTLTVPSFGTGSKIGLSLSPWHADPRAGRGIRLVDFALPCSRFQWLIREASEI